MTSINKERNIKLFEIGIEDIERPDFLYRSTDAVREDISNIKEKISELKRSFSIRELMLDMLSEKRPKGESEWLYDLEALLSEAETAYSRLAMLREELLLLEAELKEVKCKIKI